VDTRRVAWTGIVALLLALAIAAPVKLIASNRPASAAEPPADTSTVTMAGLRFSPATLTVRKGTQVLFDNDDVAPHTVTADAGGVDSGTLNPGVTFKLAIDQPFAYHCAIHPSMTAKIELTG
jgi:plastocyanin